MHGSCFHRDKVLLVISAVYARVKEVPTYSAAVWSSTDDVVIKIEIGVENVSVELYLAVELVADFLPIGYGFGHCLQSLASYWSHVRGK